MDITIEALLAGLSKQIPGHSDDKVESINKTDKGYEVIIINQNGEKESFAISPEDAKKISLDSIDDEIALYSRMENIVYISLTASRLILSKKISGVPLPVLVTTVIQLAEDFDREHGTENVGEDTVKAINQYAEKKLVEQFGK